MTASRQPGAISKLKEIRSLLSRSEKRRVLLLLCLMLCATLIEVIGVGSVFPLLQILATPDRFTQGAMAAHFRSIGLTSTKEIALLLTLSFAIFLVLSNALSLLVYSESTKFAWANWRNISTKAFAHYLHQPYEFFLSRNSADLTKVVTQDSEFIGYGILLPLLRVIAKFMVIVALGLTLLVFEPLVTLLLLAFFTSAYGAFSFYSHRAVRRSADIAQQGRIRSTRVAAEALRGIKEVKTFGKENYFISQFVREIAPVPKAEKSIDVLGGAPRYFLEAITIACVLSGLGIAIYQGVELATLMPTIGLFMVAGYRMLPLFSQGYENLTTLIARLVTIDDMLADLRMHRVVPATVAPAAEPAAGSSRLAEIILADITYSYPMTTAPALSKLSLTLEPGKRIGLLGMSGGGKSTLIDVLLTLLEPQAGQMRMGDVFIERSNAHRFRRHIGYVPQTIFLTDDSILRNIAFGVDDKEIDMEAVVKAAKRSHIHDFILSLELGYQTMIGERGVRLSGGQRQRLGIARALYTDPPFVVFDEATSALDAETEAAVMEAIDRLDNKTVIMVAHRLSTLKRCDAVYEIQNGRLLYRGRGETLLAHA
jgi:ABC-type multidrug transport system fused ATPase/permease subunit